MVNIPGWTPELERSFKQVLFRFLEEIQCTKAALYLLAEDGRFALLTQYGFGRRNRLAAEFHADDPVVLKARELHGDAAAFNSPEEFEGMAGYLGGAGSKRLLLVPVYGASRLIGFADARDKGRKQSFTEADVAAAGAIARELLATAVRYEVYPELELGSEVEAEVETGATVSSPQAPAERRTAPRDPGTAGVGLDEVSVERMLEMCQELGDRNEVAGVALTVAEGGTAGTVMWLPGASAEVDRTAVLRHQSDALRVQRVTVPDMAVWSVALRALAHGAAGVAAQAIASGVLLRSGTWALIASVIGEAGSSAAADGLTRLQKMAHRCREGSELRYARRRMARSLLEEGSPGIPELVDHSESVSRLAWSLARVLGQDHGVAEEVAVAGLLHDVGMRRLGSTELYRRADVGRDERRRYQEHVVAGERQVREAGLFALAGAVRHHHERWDGAGYPDRLEGEAIPLVSRIVHVAEVFDVLTSKVSYRRTLSSGQALSVIRASSGRQFDPGVVEALERIAG